MAESAAIPTLHFPRGWRRAALTEAMAPAAALSRGLLFRRRFMSHQSPSRPVQSIIECWLTGAYATVLAAASQAGRAGEAATSDDPDEEREQARVVAAPRCRSLSPFSAAETVRRLESAALRRGQVVFASLAARPGRFASDWLVLGID